MSTKKRRISCSSAELLQTWAGPKTPRTKATEPCFAAAVVANGSPEERVRVLVAPLEGEVGMLETASWDLCKISVTVQGQQCCTGI